MVFLVDVAFSRLEHLPFKRSLDGPVPERMSKEDKVQIPILDFVSTGKL